MIACRIINLLGLFLSIVIISISTFKNSLSNTMITNKRFRYYNPLFSCTRSLAMVTQYDKQKIAIIGGGFGGLYTALQIDSMKDPDIEITLFDPKDKFVFLPLLYELAVGTASVTEVSPLYEDLLEGSNIKFVKSNVTDIDVKGRKVHYSTSDHSDAYEFDQCIIAAGTQPRSNLIVGAYEYAIPFYRVTDAYKLQNELRALVDQHNRSTNTQDLAITIIGAGYSGVEVATNVAQYLSTAGVKASIRLVDRNSNVMHTSAEHNRITAEK